MADLRDVLYVDDDPDIRALVEIALGVAGGLDVRMCASGPEALERAHAEPPELIVLDVMMPEMDGPAVLAAIREDPVLEGIPVAFHTAKWQLEERKRLLELGAVAVLAKPFDPMALADDLRTVWASATGGGPDGDGAAVGGEAAAA